MQTTRHFDAIAFILVLLLAGCGGGGSDAPGTSVAPASPPPANGSYAGTYSCQTVGADLVFTAVLPTATGAFSSCSGGAASVGITMTCTGTIAADGTFGAAGIDSHGNTLSFSGTASATDVTGTYGITPAGIAGNFQCRH